MKSCGKLTAALSVAAGLLLEGCAGTEDSAALPPAVENTRAPELIGSWQSACINVTAKSGFNADTFTRSSGGGSGSGGGASYRDTISFTREGYSTFSSERFATAFCNSNTLIGVDRLESVYEVGDNAIDRNGAAVVELVYHTTTNSVYSIFQITNGIELKLGDDSASSPGRDGSTAQKRLDGLGVTLNRQ